MSAWFNSATSGCSSDRARSDHRSNGRRRLPVPRPRLAAPVPGCGCRICSPDCFPEISAIRSGTVEESLESAQIASTRGSRACPCRDRGTGAGPGRGKAEHPRHLRRRHRADQHRGVHARRDGLQDAEHRPHRQGGHALHRLLRRAELHRRPVDVHHRAVHAAHGAIQGRHARRRRSACRSATSPSPRRSRPWATPPGSSARTTSATATSTCRPRTASTSSSATSTTSTPRRSRRTPTTRRTRSSGRSSARAASSSRSPTARSRTPAR